MSAVVETTKVIYKHEENTYEISSKFTKSVDSFPFDKKDCNWHNRFRISIKRNDSKKISFQFYDSTHNYGKGIKVLSEQDTKDAFFECILGDALAFGNCRGFDDFCSEFGYGEDSRQAERIYKACEKTLNKLEDIDFSVDEIIDLVNDYNHGEDKEENS